MYVDVGKARRPGNPGTDHAPLPDLRSFSRDFSRDHLRTKPRHGPRNDIRHGSTRYDWLTRHHAWLFYWWNSHDRRNPHGDRHASRSHALGSRSPSARATRKRPYAE